MGGGVLCRAGPGDPRLVMAFVPLGCLWGAWALPMLGTGPKLPKPDTGGLRPGWVVVGRKWGGDKPSVLQPLSALGCCGLWNLLSHPDLCRGSHTHTQIPWQCHGGWQGLCGWTDSLSSRRLPLDQLTLGCLRGSCGWHLSGAVAIISQSLCLPVCVLGPDPNGADCHGGWTAGTRPLSLLPLLPTFLGAPRLPLRGRHSLEVLPVPRVSTQVPFVQLSSPELRPHCPPALQVV